MCFSGNEVLTQLVRVLLSTSMFVGGFVGIVLDNTIPGNKIVYALRISH